MLTGDPKRAGKAPKYRLRFTMQHLSKATHKSLAAMRQDKYLGIYNPTDLVSLAAYITRCQQKANKPRKKRRGKPSMPPKQSDSTT